MPELRLPEAETGPEARKGQIERALARRTGSTAVMIHGQKMDDQQLDLLTRTICKDADPDEFALFVQVCNRTGLDPFSRQIHAVKRYDSKARREVMSIQTGIDGYRLIAQRSGEYAGSDEPVFDTETAPHPNKATVTVYKVVQGVRCPVSRSARWDEYRQEYRHRQSGEMRLTPLWAKMPYTMLAKCAEAQALRAAFPQELSGVYTTEEMMQSGGLREPDGTPTEEALAVDATVETSPAPTDLELKIKALRDPKYRSLTAQAAVDAGITLNKEKTLETRKAEDIDKLYERVFGVQDTENPEGDD